MDVPKCPQCGMPLESSSYYAKGMTMKCGHCGHSGLPLTLGACIYDKVKVEKPPKPRDIFENELSLPGVLSKLALISLILTIASLCSPLLHSVTTGSLLAFLLFSLTYGFLKLKSG